MTDAYNDEVLATLVERFGNEGYGVWWRILEIIADKMGPGSAKTEAAYPKRKWLSLCSFHHKRQHIFNGIIEFLASGDKPKFIVVHDGDILKINCPKLSEIRDEYTRKSVQRQDKLPTESGQTPETEKQDAPPQQMKKPSQTKKDPEVQKATIDEQLEELLSRYSEEEKQDIHKLLNFLRLTRRGGKLAENIIITEISRWNTLDVARVMYGVRKYIDCSYYAEGKKEGYLWAIMKNASPGEIMKAAQKIIPSNGSSSVFSPVSEHNAKVIHSFRKKRNAAEID